MFPDFFKNSTHEMWKELIVEHHKTLPFDGLWIVSVTFTRLQFRVPTRKIIFLFLDQTYVVGTQKNRLNETVLLGTSNICEKF